LKQKQGYRFFSDLAIEAHEAALSHNRRRFPPRDGISETPATIEPGSMGDAASMESPGPAGSVAAAEALDKSGIDGVAIHVDESGGLRVTSVEITDERGAAEMGKPVGKYITIECQRIKEPDPDAHDAVAAAFAGQLGALHGLDADAVVLVVGLGNWNVTADSLGPKVIAKTLVTRHLSEENRAFLGEGGARQVCAISPGVMGLTGIETGEIVKGITDRVKPDLVIAIDALAARRVSRINSTIQLSNTGINPGAGIGNFRASINDKTLGVPVIAVGVPTVVDAATLVNDTMDKFLEAIALEELSGGPGSPDFYDMLRSLENSDKHSLIKDVLEPYAGNMFVTPKDVDAVIERLANIIANGLNIALHPGLTADDLNRFLG